MSSLRKVVVIVALPVCAAANTLHVPGDYGTIQAALGTAAPGDVVLVAPGTYYENLSMPSDVILQSQAGPGVTTIDGSSGGSVIDCIGVSASTEIRGFLITHGIGSPQAALGGGVRCWTGASPLIEGNVFSQNTASHGGAIGCRFDSWPTIRGNEFHDNYAWSEGGAIYAIDGLGGTITIESNTVLNGRANSGGGLWIGAIDALIAGNRVENNEAAIAAGGMWLGFAGTKTASGNVLVGNYCDTNLGGATWINEGTTAFVNNTLYGNISPAGGAIATGGLGTKWIQRNIIAASPQGAGIHCTAAGNTSVECNDLWGNAGGDLVPACVTDAGGNFRAYPAFCGPTADLNLSPNSPCLPGGNSCGVLIGALPMGSCSPVAVAPSTWGVTKASYR